MANFNDRVTSAKTWATGHVVTAAAISAAVGFLLCKLF